MEAAWALRIDNPSAASALMYALLSYILYSSLTFKGERLGMTTLAPHCKPMVLPLGSMLPSAVVEGRSAFGNISLRIASIRRVRCKSPCFSLANGVWWWGIKGPMPIMSGCSSCKKRRSAIRCRGVW